MSRSIKKFLRFATTIGFLIFLPIIILCLFIAFLLYGIVIASKRSIETTLEIVFRTVENLRKKIEGE